MLLIALIPLSFILTQCFTSTAKDPRGELYAGSESCVKCHSSVYDSYIHTAHFQSSRPASLNNIGGSFAKGSNVFEYGNGFKVVMEKRGDSLYQTGYLNGKKQAEAPFDVAIGGVKAQTYLYWKGSQLFELPVSYFTAVHAWANSPGYAMGYINFQRPILKKCLECHTSFVDDVAPEKMEIGFDKATLIYGIDCERCHGPAANHVNYHTAYPEEKKAKYITTYSSLTRAQKMDACALCHSGNKGVFQRSSYTFKMGDTLAKFKTPDFYSNNLKNPPLDVHGNQTALLSSSKCFIMSNMDCNTCHDPHARQDKGLAIYTPKCLSCHSEAKHNFCPLGTKLGTAINSYCINCHMPQQASHIIQLKSSEGKMDTPYLLRTHHIAVYPEETEKVLAFIKAQSSPVR